MISRAVRPGTSPGFIFYFMPQSPFVFARLAWILPLAYALRRMLWHRACIACYHNKNAKGDKGMEKTGIITTAEKEVIETAVYCDGCGEAITDGWTFEKDGEVFCKSCFESDFVKCNGCGDFINTDDVSYHNEDAYCQTCFDDTFCICDDCGEPFLADDGWLVNYRNPNWHILSKVVCESCLENNYQRCEDCGEYWREDDTYYTGHGYHICASCYENGYGCCDDCNEIYHADDLIYSDRYGEAYCQSCARTHGGHAINDYLYKPAPKFRHFNQNTNESVFSASPGNRLYAGFELELESPREPAWDVAQTLIDNFDEDEDVFYCKHDGSLDDGFEIVSHPMTLRAHKTMDYSDMLAELKKAGCKSHNTTTCGLHVHVSRSFFTMSETVKLGLFVYFNKSRLETFARRTETYHAKFKPVLRSDLKAAGHSDRRYEAINFENARTIEFRLFKGTLNFETFMATLEFCDAVSRFVKTVSACSIVNKNGGFDLFKTFVNKDGNRKLYKNLIQYLDARGL